MSRIHCTGWSKWSEARNAFFIVARSHLKPRQGRAGPLVSVGWAALGGGEPAASGSAITLVRLGHSFAVASLVTALPLAHALPQEDQITSGSVTYGVSAKNTVPQMLDKVEISASRVPTTLGETTESVSVITRAQIDRMDVSSGVDLFRQVPGLQIDQLGGPGGLSSVYIRGSDPNHVLVLIDGVRVNDPTNSRGGGFDMSSINPGTIERIEVLRGAASSVYGAEAMGGVINIITRAASGTGMHGIASAGMGGIGYRSLNARVSIGDENQRFSIGTSRLLDGKESEGGRLALSQVDAGAHWAPEARLAFDFDARYGERQSSAFPDDSGGLHLAKIRTLEDKHSHDLSISGRARGDLDEVTFNFGASRYEHVEDTYSPGVGPGIRSHVGVPSSLSNTLFRRNNLTTTAVFHLGVGTELAIGGEFQREQGENQTVYTFFGQEIPADFNLTRNTRSAFTELKWQITPELLARAGLRYDNVDGNGSHTSPSLGVRYKLAGLDGSLKASYSEGFKPPSFFALGLPVVLGGNPNLRAESSKGGSIGYEQNFWGDQATAGVSLFKTHYTDLVTFDNETNKIVNANQVDIKGAEFETSVRATKSINLHAHFTRLFSHVMDSNEPLRQRPGRRAGVQLSWALPQNAQLNWRAEYTAQVFDSSVPTGNLTLPTSLRNDVNVTWRLQALPQNRVTFSAGIDNVFDKANESYVGQPAPGRRFRLNVSAVL